MDNYLKELQKNWDGFGKADPLYAILVDPNKKGNKWNVKEFFKTGEDEINRLFKHIDDLKIKVDNDKMGKALDFGCGVGRLTQALSKYFPIVNGIDIASSMIELATKYKHTMGNVFVTDYTRYILNESEALDKFEDNSIDFIISIITLQHIRPDYAKGYIKEFLRILKPKGILIFHVPDEFMIFNGTEYVNSIEYFEEYVIDGKMKDLIMEMNGISKEEIMKLVKNNGGKMFDIQIHDTKEKLESFNYFVTK